jgi:hypothetical protein
MTVLYSASVQTFLLISLKIKYSGAPHLMFFSSMFIHFSSRKIFRCLVFRSTAHQRNLEWGFHCVLSNKLIAITHFWHQTRVFNMTPGLEVINEHCYILILSYHLA